MARAQQHAAGVLGFAEALRDVLERQVFELAEQDDLAMRIAEGVERRLELAGLFVDDDLRQHRSHARRQIGMVVDRRLASRIAALALVIVGAVDDLAIRDAGQPRHQRLAIRRRETLRDAGRISAASPEGCRETRAARAACDRASAGCRTAASACSARTSDRAPDSRPDVSSRPPGPLEQRPSCPGRPSADTLPRQESGVRSQESEVRR